jgi:hypothetical protein
MADRLRWRSHGRVFAPIAVLCAITLVLAILVGEPLGAPDTDATPHPAEVHRFTREANVRDGAMPRVAKRVPREVALLAGISIVALVFVVRRRARFRPRAVSALVATSLVRRRGPPVLLPVV